MAKFGQFTDYAPHPEIPGAYNFGTPQGPMLFSGTEAQQLKARLDAANQATTVAGDNAAPGFNARAAAAELTGQPPPPAGPSPAQPSPPPSAAPPGMVPYSPENGIDIGTYKNAAGKLVERVAGTKGVNQDDLKKRDATAVAQRTGESQTVTGGFEQSQEYKSDMAKAAEDQQRAIEEKRNADITAQEQGRAVAGQQFEAQTAQLQQQQALTNQVQAHVEQAQAVRDQALKDYSSTKIDPNQMFGGGAGALKAIGAALAAGMGAYGASINHTQNFAQQAIDAAINRNIAGQEANLRVKKDAADNALGDLVRRGMSLDQAKGTLATIQRSWAAQQLQLAQGASGTDQINANANQMLAGLNKNVAQETEQYRQHSLGQATTAVQSQFAHTVAGSAGGYRELTPEQALKRVGQVTENQGKTAATAATIDKIGKGGKKSEGDQKAAAAIATADTALKSLSAYKDDEVPQILGNQDVASATYHRAKDLVLGDGASARGMSERDRSLIQDTEAARGYVKGLTSVLSGQGALSGPESAAADRGLSPSATVGDLRRAVAIVKARSEAIVAAGGSVDQQQPETPQ
jgi:hypothetical protein